MKKEPKTSDINISEVSKFSTLSPVFFVNTTWETRRRVATMDTKELEAIFLPIITSETARKLLRKNLQVYIGDKEPEKFTIGEKRQFVAYVLDNSEHLLAEINQEAAQHQKRYEELENDKQIIHGSVSRDKDIEEISNQRESEEQDR